MTAPIQVSFIIPTFNEERMLLNTLECIEAYKPKSLSCEIIVADNGSEDGTVEIAKKHAKVLIDKEATVGGLRNLAVKSSKGKVLVFLDADVLLTEMWNANFLAAYELLLENPSQVTGSRCAIPTPSSWIEATWFKSIISQGSSYINSGHLITTRELFDKINGFDEALETGEDYAFGQSALRNNAKVVDNSLLTVVHEGYPKSFSSFVKREIWHGSGDCRSLQSFFSSRVAIASLGFLILHLAFFLSLVNGSYVFAMISLTLIILMCVSAAVLKHKAKSLRKILHVSFLYYFYFFARLLSLVPFLNKRASRHEVT